jgi:NAD+ synthase (glutamine-hydrolysing)
LFEALALGVGDYFTKTGAFGRIGVAVSGGRDSMLSLLIGWRAVQRLHAGLDGAALQRRAGELLGALYFPTHFSAAATRAAAEEICRELGVPLLVSSIEEAFQRELEAVRVMLGSEPTPVTMQNIQARIRANRMWNWCNSVGALFLQTGDMSEKAVGYTTVGGDLEGGLSPIANLPKTVVIALLERLHRRFGFRGIGLCLGTEPGPELAADQKAEAELMPFPVLDACLQLYAGEKLSPEEIPGALAALFPDGDPGRLQAWAGQFVTRFTNAIFKWVQAPISLHVGSLDLERERALQLPVVQRNEWSKP